MSKIVKQEYDDRGNVTYREWSNGYWAKREYDNHGNEIYYENSLGEKRGTPRVELNRSRILNEPEVDVDI